MSVLELTDSKLSIRTYEPPPAEFDPLTASARHLLRHGFPQRPDPAEEPELFAQFKEALCDNTTFVEAAFRHREDKQQARHRPFESQRERTPAQSETITTFISTHQSGAQVWTPSPFSHFKWIQATWTVPDPKAPTGGFFYASEYIAIAGETADDAILTGTETEVHFDGTTVSKVVYPIWQLGRGLIMEITSVAIGIGDVVSFLLCVNSAEATIIFKNHTSGLATTFTVTAPAPFEAFYAEWIVERPLVVGKLSSLANVGTVRFDSAKASYDGPTGRIILPAGAGELLKMVGTTGTTLATATTDPPRDLNAEAVLVEWAAASLS